MKKEKPKIAYLLNGPDQAAGSILVSASGSPNPLDCFSGVTGGLEAAEDET